jgi:hypothetical protein
MLRRLLVSLRPASPKSGEGMYCHQCGTQLPAEANFCAKCGTKTVSSHSVRPTHESTVSPETYEVPSQPSVAASNSRCFASARLWALFALIPALTSSCQLLARHGAAEFIASVIAKFIMWGLVIFAVAYGICRLRSK